MSGGPRSAHARSALQADFYLLVLAAVYHADGLWGEATFDLYPRGLPPGSAFWVAAGIEEAVDTALGWEFSERDIAWLRSQPAFEKASSGWWSSLEHFRFSGDIHAVREGTPVFPGEPVLRITAPLPQAVLLQTALVQKVSLACAVATRAARLARAAGGKRLYEFATRRLPGVEAGRIGARAACVGGFYATSNADAAAHLGIPVMGTLSTDFMAAYGSDTSALDAFSLHFPDVGFVNLPAGTVTEAVATLAPYRKHIRMVRVDHPRLGAAARQVRQALDRMGMEGVLILGTGSLNEERIARLVQRGDPIDLFGVGNELGRAVLSPGFRYRLAQIWRGPDPEPCVHPGGAPWPGQKQIFRFEDHDTLALAEEDDFARQGGVPLLEAVVEAGERVREPRTALEGQAWCAEALARFPAALLEAQSEEVWPLRVSDRVRMLRG